MAHSTLTVAGEIYFTYLTNDLFNIVSLKTMYRGKNMKDDKGNSLVDDFAISQDERGAFDQFLKTAANLVFRSVLKITKGVDDAILIDIDSSTTAAVVLKIIDNDAYNENVLTYVDFLIKETIIYKIMSEWYKTCGHDTEYAKMEANYQESNRQLFDGLFELRKPLIS